MLNSLKSTLLSHFIWGYLSLEFIAFPNIETEEIQVWGVDITPWMSESLSSFIAFNALIEGELDLQTGGYFIRYTDDDEEWRYECTTDEHDFNIMTSQNPNPSHTYESELPKYHTFIEDYLRPDYEDGNLYDSREYSFIWGIEHNSFSNLDIRTFFNRCRMEDINYNFPQRYGLLFCLYGSFNSFGVISINAKSRFINKQIKECLEFMYRMLGENDSDNYYELSLRNLFDFYQKSYGKMKSIEGHKNYKGYM